MARLTAAAGSSSCGRASTELLSSSNRAPDIGRPRPLSAWAYERRLIQGRVLEAATAREGADEAKPDRVSMARIRREAQQILTRAHERGDGTEKSPHTGRAKLTPSGVHLKFLSRAGGRYVTDVTVPPQMTEGPQPHLHSLFRPNLMVCGLSEPFQPFWMPTCERM